MRIFLALLPVALIGCSTPYGMRVNHVEATPVFTLLEYGSEDEALDACVTFVRVSRVTGEDVWQVGASDQRNCLGHRIEYGLAPPGAAVMHSPSALEPGDDYDVHMGVLGGGAAARFIHQSKVR